MIFFISLLNSTKDVKRVVKKINILDVFVVKNAFEKSYDYYSFNY